MTMTLEKTNQAGEIAALQKEIARLREKNERLLKVSKQADAANKAKSDFLAMISHEIRTPMNGVIGLTELLLDTEMDARQQHFTSLIMTSARNLLTLINSLLDFSKIEADMMELDIVEFDLRGLVEELMSLYSVAGHRKDIDVYAEIDERVAGRYAGDSYRIRQILVNLLGNGIKFTEKGSVILRVKCTRTDADADILRFEIHDSGPGIPSDKVDRLFKPFSQVDSSSTRRYGGTGLGLSICQKLVELMKGEIGVESGSDTGSIFWFTIPLPAVEAGKSDLNFLPTGHDIVLPHAAPGEDAGREEGAGPLILIVEDDETNQFVLKTILERTGARVNIARNGREAVEKFAAGKHYELIFMDCQMPIMDGFAATRSIHRKAQEQAWPRPPIIALTADATSSTRHHCREVGMDDHLVKPLDFSKLQQVVDNWLPGRGLRVISERHLEEMSRKEDLHIEDSMEMNQINTQAFGKLKQTMGNISPVIRVFLESLPRRLQELENAVARDDYEEVRRLAHTLKGSSSQFGAAYLANLSMRIENMARSEKLEGIDLLLEKIGPAADLVVEFLTEELD